MGLDMYATVKGNADLIDELGIERVEWGEDKPLSDDDKDNIERLFFYWRKHNALHVWMEEKWEELGRPGFDPDSMGGSLGDFNCVPFKLDKEILEELERDTNAECMVPQSGFFFGDTDPETYRQWNPVEDDRKFIELAKKAVDAGLEVYYDSWW